MQTEFLRENNGRIAKLVAIFIIVLTLFVLVKTLGELKSYQFIGGNPDVQSTISVSGEGEVFAVSDIASFNFSVVEESKVVSEAQTNATEKINEAIKYLKGEGIEEKDIKTLSYNINPRYEYTPCTEFSCPPERRTLSGYEVSQTVEVKVREADRAGDILSGIGSFEVSNISGLNLTVDNEDDLLVEARQKAINDAREKAEELAESLGVRLVRIVSFSENGRGGTPAYFKAYNDVAEQALGAPSSAPEIPRGENKIISNVNITYEIR